jgi:hypothetical protein
MTDEVVNKESASGIGSTEHDQAMIEQADKTIEQVVQEKVDQQEAKPKKDIPDWIPEKYKNAEDPIEAFLAGHKSLEQKLGGNEEREDPSNSKGEEETPDESKDETVKSGPLDPFYSEYSEAGELSPESYQQLEELGYPKDVVDTYIKGYEAQIAQYTQEAAEMVGGQEEYDAMAEWAVDNLTPEQLDNYNEQLALGGDAWEYALRGLHAKYKQSGDAPVERVNSGEKQTLNKGVQPFTSQEELTAATRDRRYQTSPEYRKMVEQRLAISDDAAMGANIPNPYAAQG